MKVQELKTLIKEYDRETLSSIIVELYKSIPKAKKENDGIDAYLNNPRESKEEKKTDNLNFEELYGEIQLFLGQAREGLYSSPNKTVSKEKRTKWRFKVKSYYKVLSNIPPDAPDGGMSTKLLVDIYMCLSRATYYRTFSNYETFRSIGIMQSAYFNMLADRLLYKNTTSGALNILVSLLAVSEDGSWFEENDLVKCFVDKVCQTNLIDQILEPLSSCVKDEYVPMRAEKEKIQSVYYYDRIIDNLSAAYARLCFEKDDPQEGIEFFIKYYNQRYTSSRVYDLLKILLEYNYYKEWMEIYEKYEKDVGRMNIQDDYKVVKNKLKGK